ncbi:MAG: glutathione peroxidase [Bacteroidetes bacterium]|nr:MAG: glutathione peroxidase [Bacteroidota bacterium]
MRTIHGFDVDGLEGERIDFAAFAGKKVLIVNVASECGYTPQYQQLQELYTVFQDRLVVVGFPSNDFGGQEPGNAEDIRQFCTRRYGVTFPLAAKVQIREPHTHPVYRWLTTKAENGVADSTVSWNFQKYLLDEEGRLLAVFPTVCDPLDPSLLRYLEV